MTKKKKAVGVLPPKEWLIKNGYRDLVKCMEKHPEIFAYIKQNKGSVSKGDKH